MEIKEQVGKRKTGIILSAVIVAAIAALLIFSKVSITVGEQAITVKAGLERSVIAYEDIVKVEKVSSITVGKRIMGADLIKIYSGTFKNEQYGRYRLYIYKDVSNYIVVEHKEGFAVFNSDTTERTDSLYEDILEKLKR